MSVPRDAVSRVMEVTRKQLGDGCIAIDELPPDIVRIAVARSAVRKAVEILVTEFAARFLITVGTDNRQDSNAFGIMHVFSLDADQLFVLVDCSVAADDPHIDSITPIVPGAGWAEREVRDVVGVSPDGHPDPRRLVLSDDWPEGVHPLRKDFPYDHKPPPAQGVQPPLREPPPGASVVPMGPFFPVLEEPAYFRLFVEGEAIVGCDYRGFYNHRGIEKMGDTVLTYNEIPYIAERICGICGFIHSCCYCQAVENAAGITVPARGRFIRTIMLELERIHSHLLWLGIAGHIIGFDTVLMQTWRIREPVMWICEEISGNRKTYGMNQVGGVRRDITEEQSAKILDVLVEVQRESLAVRDAIVGDTTLHARTRQVGVLTPGNARDICVVGPPARASGVKIDSRLDHPYAAYREVPPKIALAEGCDIWARVLVRVEELVESIRMVREALNGLPEGPVCADILQDIPSGRIGVSVVEAPRGEAVHVVITGGRNRPHRWRVRAPTYPNLQAIPVMIAGGSIADVPITLGSLDPCFSCTERFEVVDVRTSEIRVCSREELQKLAGRSGGSQ